MTERHEHLIDWLKDAHAMEQQAEQMLEAQIGRLQNYPKLRTRLEKHLEETRDQKRLVEQALERLGHSPSTLKDLGARLGAFAQAAGTMLVEDEVLKAAMAGHVFEQMEVAAYTVLLAAAEAAGDEETRVVCEAILPQEQAMAAWTLAHLPELTQAFLDRAEAPGLEAKR
ncbi:DUF892 family protein [Pseudomonas otitidis]|uniref:ferritin-like domain-containing protein n=1 Tax=Metapseudomonas otitidis TaxID=319939 RepID=UPI00244B023B|nr:DUF892 family protein [Pseudomonas otitidis]MDH0335351.1 DUF892 family protein [Pseudomonas otitidis]MDH1105259.1 DUF892 family protein [Pseudomonas otitidis]MDH1161386.1 DUF892 family protein [Pseudomonas otitidis]MDH1163029.1 DUF892 family protein [Pseudomonas otitidis]